VPTIEKGLVTGGKGRGPVGRKKSIYAGYGVFMRSVISVGS
jgi:hypothetical protein